jgi:hypothetical protein
MIVPPGEGFYRTPATKHPKPLRLLFQTDMDSFGFFISASIDLIVNSASELWERRPLALRLGSSWARSLFHPRLCFAVIWIECLQPLAEEQESKSVKTL